MVLTTVILVFTFLIQVFGFDPHSNSNVVVYWGQNSAGQAGSQQRLSYYCNSPDVDIIILSFIHVFPDPVNMNFANACEGTATADGILQCQTIAEDIKTCQAEGKVILLSLGGAAGSYSMTDAEAPAFAQTLWDLFGNSKNLTPDQRPFFDSVLDGFDFDIENNMPAGYATLADSLRKLFATDSSKTYYLGAAPQCPYPDASVGPLLQDSYIDFVFIQFYNNYCSLQGQFNWDTWLNYAQNTSPNKNVKLFAGLPGSQTAAGSGYVAPNLVSNYITPQLMSSPYFGGISLWDASQAWANIDANGNTYVHDMKALVAEAPSVASPNTVSTASSSTTSSSTTSSSTTSSSTTSSSTTSSSTTSSSTISSSTSSILTSSSVITSSSSTLISTSSSTVSSSTVPTSTTTSSTTTTSSSSSSTTPTSSRSTTTNTNTATKVFTEFVYAPTTLVTVQTSYQVKTTITHLQTVYGKPTGVF
ncbi:uncharacterized protein SPAPADRAFT_59094 [Spathaspora passalidarum NRRL Y-27907]|uniref:chitinase n=1 Tax=Spathaspora passalidarum (strain NRRL Y-27907 / 11-Y1) TaxID=619300 RepID=G3AIL4_SPAPN|nr:uncharacterized protein SPAPADRAFT_59094 [Spathaspora passalidarum NRRL Y-27907]EGW33729.1 hypothetical protein SPAPADRAFT_59094 [Spathaspora passalidarum NRRL Y-27907]